jgi:hypothetical protein
MKVPRIHLIEKKKLMKRLANTDSEYESGYWALSEISAKALIGGEIYFHERQAGESYFSRQITGYRVDNESKSYQGRIIFRFSYDNSCRGVTAGSHGWSNEKKLVWKDLA